MFPKTFAQIVLNAAFLIVLLHGSAAAQPPAGVVAAPSADSRPRTANPQPQYIPGWGRVVDPLGDCRVSERQGILKITVPGSFHDLHFGMDAPRVLQEVDGDFTAHVRVLKFALPAFNSWVNEEAPYNFVSGGLVVLQDEETFIRLERVGIGREDGGYPYILAKYHTHGEETAIGRYEIPNEDLWVRVQRTGYLCKLYQSTGDKWTEVLPTHWRKGDGWTATPPAGANITLRGKVQVGVYAINATNRQIVHQYSNYKLTKSDPTARKQTAQPTGARAFAFRRVVPGQTSRADLLANTLWGEPSGTSSSNGDELLRFRLRGYPDAQVLVRNGRVQTIDVTIADGVPESVAARAFRIGKPEQSLLPSASSIGAVEPQETWMARPYSAGRVVLFVETVDGQSLARLLRIYSSSSAPSSAATSSSSPQLVSLDAADTESSVNGQDARSRQIVQLVVRLLEERDYGDQKLDDQLAAKWLERYLATLDPGKLFFLREDIDRFYNMIPSIDHLARQGDIGFAYDAFNTWVDRRARTIHLVEEFLDAKHDFTIDEEIELVKPDTPWPENEIESREILRKRVKYELLRRKLDGATDEEAKEKVRRHYAGLFQVQQTFDDDDILQWALSALGAARGTADFKSARIYEEQQIGLRNRLVGIGAALKVVDGDVVVTRIVPGGPAHRDGRLAAGDVIVSVDSTNGGAGPGSRRLRGMRLTEAVSLIRGPKGTTVSLTVKPKGEDQTRVIRLQRDSLSLVSVRGTALQPPAGDGGTIGWIAVNSFYIDPSTDNSSAKDVQRLLADYRKQGVEAIVLDLRNCSGGQLIQAIDLFALFADGPVLISKSADGSVTSYRTGTNPDGVTQVAWHGPLVVLTSTLSSSGAALLAAAVQDHARGLVIGDSCTSGDARIQKYVDLGAELFNMDDPPTLGALKYTTAILHRISGPSFQGRGVAADIPLPSATEAFIRTSSVVLKTEPIQASTYADLGLVTPQTIDTLTRASEQRRRNSAQFAEVERQFEQAKWWRERRFVSLNESVSRTEQVNSINTEFPDFTGEDVVRHGPYVDEVLVITADYVQSIPWLDDYVRGWRELRGGRADAALRSFGRAIATAPDAGGPLLGRAHAHAAAANWERAIADLKKSGGDALPGKATAADQLRVPEGSVTAVDPGDRLQISNQNGPWLWANLAGDTSKKGWIKATSVRLE